MNGTKAVLAFLASVGVFAAQADEPQYGGVRFDCDVTVDGVAVAANTAIYAESWPTQFLVRPVLDEGQTIYSFTATADPGDNYLKRVYPCLNGNFYFVPPSSSGTVLDFHCELVTKIVWVDAATKDGDTNGKGTYEEPWHTLQYAVEHCGHSTSTRIIINAKPGIYNEGGKEYKGITNRVVLSEYMLLRAAEGPDVTFIEGREGTDPAYAETLPGSGPDAIRCVTFESVWDSAVQGFTLQNGHTHCTPAGLSAWSDFIKGGAFLGRDTSSQMLDCVVTNCTGGLGTVCYGTVSRCRFVGNTSAVIEYSAGMFDCLFYENKTATGVGGNWLAGRVVNCTVAEDKTIQTGPFYNSVLWGKSAWWPGSPVVYYGSVGSRASSSGYAGYTGDSKILPDIAARDFRIILSSKANGGATLPEKGTDAWAAWEKALCWSVRGDINGNRNLFANGQPVAGAVQTLAYPVSVAEDYGTLAVRSGGKVGQNYLNLGDTLVIAQADNPQRHATGIVIDGTVTNLFVNGETTYTVSASQTNAVAITPLYLPCQTIIVPMDGKARLTVTGGLGEGGVYPVETGCSITLAPNETGSRYAAGITAGGVDYYFDQLPGGVWTYTVPADFTEDTVAVTTILSKVWYVATNGNDSAKGFTTNSPLASYTAAENKASNGETIRFMPGVYGDAFGYYEWQVKDDQASHETANRRARFSIGKSVTVESLAGPEKTIILGAPAPAGDGWGRGDGAVSCVYARGNAPMVLRGFTLTGGRSPRTFSNQNSDLSIGAAFFNYRGNTYSSAIIENCIVTNNFGGYGTVFLATARNCRIVENFASSGAAGARGDFQSCLIERNVTYGGDSLRATWNISGCTIGAVNYKTNGIALGTIADTVVCSSASSEHYGVFNNNLVLGTLGYINSTIPATNCVFKTGTQSYYGNAGRHNEYCLFGKTDEEIALNADNTLGKGSVAIDAGWTALTNTVTDLNGGQRVYNGAVDAGACEYDWRGDYAKDIAKREVVVSAADPQVIEREGKATLDPGASLTAEWTPVGESARCDVKASVTGTGTLTVSVDGVAIGTVTAADSPKTFNFAGAIGETSKIVFSYSQEEGDEGCAVIEKVGSQKGLLLLVR